MEAANSLAGSEKKVQLKKDLLAGSWQVQMAPNELVIWSKIYWKVSVNTTVEHTENAHKSYSVLFCYRHLSQGSQLLSRNHRSTTRFDFQLHLQNIN